MSSKTNWTQQEDEFLKSYEHPQKRINWIQLSRKINQKFPSKIRSGKQCRQRYINYASISQISDELKQWSNEQIQKLFAVFYQMGPKWTYIASQLKGKTENSVKNKFYGFVRKFIRTMNRYISQVRKKKIKQLRTQSLLRILHISQLSKSLKQQLKIRSEILRKQILYFLNPNNHYEQNNIHSLIQKINKFNLDTRSYKIQHLAEQIQLVRNQNMNKQQQILQKSTKNIKNSSLIEEALQQYEKALPSKENYEFSLIKEAEIQKKLINKRKESQYMSMPSQMIDEQMIGQAMKQKQLKLHHKKDSLLQFDCKEASQQLKQCYLQ